VDFSESALALAQYIKKMGLDILGALLSGIVSSLLVFTTKLKINILRKKYNQRSYTFKTESLKIKVRYKVLGKKLKLA